VVHRPSDDDGNVLEAKSLEAKSLEAKSLEAKSLEAKSLEAKSAKRKPSVGLCSGRNKARGRGIVKTTLRPGRAGGSKQFFVLEKQDLTGGTRAGGGRLGGDERRGWRRDV
jgi:hypothetical protein